MRRLLTIACLMFGIVVPLASVHASAAFADPAFQQQWQQGEAITPNFWGPLSTARDGQQEPYQEAQGGQRLVQYFDKGRMELTNGDISNGLLASEIVKGQIQTGVATYQPKSPPAIPIAGDSDNSGPTYASLSTTAVGLLVSASSQLGSASLATVAADGTVKPNDVTANGRAVIGAFDDATKHNVPGVFLDYRDVAGVRAIGYAISEPFAVNVKVGGQQRLVEVQVFERRVLTYTPDNPPAFQVEMGNIGQHYYQWRYASGLTQQVTPPTVASPPTVSPPAATTASTVTPPAKPQVAASTPIAGGTTYTDQNGKWTIQYPTGWSVQYNGTVLTDMFGPNTCLFEILEGPKLSSFSLDAELDIYKGVVVPGKGAGLGATEAVSIGGESGKMFAYRSAATSTSTNADYGGYAAAFHGDKLYTFSYLLSYTTSDTCGRDARAMIASFRFTDGSAPATSSTSVSAGTSSRAYSVDLNCSDFASQADAQAYLRLYPDDPSDLDANHNGIACQDNKAPYDKTPVAITNTVSAPSGSSAGCTSNCSVYVSGYFKKNGTYVSSYYRSPPHHK